MNGRATPAPPRHRQQPTPSATGRGEKPGVGPTRFLLTVDLFFGNSVWDFGKSRFDIGFPNIYLPPIPSALTRVTAHNTELLDRYLIIDYSSQQETF